MSDIDPFRHHPALRAVITPRADSFFRDFRAQKVLDMLAEQGLPADWVHDDLHREADRQATLEGRMDDDLWVFGYGSLMWDPGFAFAEVRRALVNGAARRFILVDSNGGRGTPEAPGVMAALDRDPDDTAACEGLVFRIARPDLEVETVSLWHRERLGTAYESAFLPAQTAFGTVEALCFVADHSAENIHADLDHEAQVRLCATGEGRLGTSRAYLENLAAHFDTMGIEDAEVDRLLRDVRAYAPD